VKQIAVLINPTIAMLQLGLQKLPQAERPLGVGLVVIEASKPDQFETALEAAQKQGAEAIDVWNGPMVFTNSARIVGLAAHYQLPEIYWDRGSVVGGGLMSYAPRLSMRAKTLSCWHKYLDEFPSDRGRGPRCFNGLPYHCGVPQRKIVCQQIRGIPFEYFLDPAAYLKPGARWVNS